MRIKSFTGATLSEAMALVRAEMGPDAVILSVDDGKRGRNVCVRAAVEGRAALVQDCALAIAEPDAFEAGLSEQIELRLRRLLREGETGFQTAEGHSLADVLRKVLQFHGTSNETASTLIERALDSGHDTPIEALASALGRSISFGPLPHRTARPLLLCGAFGHGKTTAAARLAMRAVEAGVKPVLLSLDFEKAGAVSQMKTYAELLKLSCHFPKSDQELGDLLSGQKPGDTWIIDTPGLDPRHDGGQKRLKALTTLTKAEAILIIAAGGDPFEMMEAATAFAGMGARRCIVTRMDTTRRLGGILNAFISLGIKGEMTLSHASHSPYLSDGLRPLHPVHLARRLIVSAIPELGITQEHHPLAPGFDHDRTPSL